MPARVLTLTAVAAFAISLSPSLAGEARADHVFEMLRSYYATDALPLDVRETSREETDGILRRDLTFTAFDNEPVAARLEIPLDRENPPVILLLHGMTQSLAQWWREDTGPYSFPSRHRQAFLAAGYAVFAIDARNHGDRLGPTDFADPYTYLEKGYLEAAKKMISQSVIDARRAIDVLETLQGIDSSRIGLSGFSLGGYIGFLTTAVDSRVEASMIMAMPFTPVARGETQNYLSQFAYLEGLKDRKIGMIAATEDHFYRREPVDALVAAIPSKVDMTWIESGHDLPDSTKDIAVTFFAKNL